MTKLAGPRDVWRELLVTLRRLPLCEGMRLVNIIRTELEAAFPSTKGRR